MKTLLILRHAKSSWGKPHLADHDRPLNKRGKRDAPRMGYLADREGLVPDLVITSSARRAVDTAEAFAYSSGYDGDIRITRDLYHADATSFISLLGGLNDELKTVMIVGHNPGMEELLEELTGIYERMTTAAMAQIRLPVEGWRHLNDEIDGQLIQLWRPKELDTL